MSLRASTPWLPWAVCLLLCLPASGQHGERVTLTVAQDGSGDFNGTDDEPIREALLRLRASGGTLQIEAGEYLVRRTILVPPGVTVRGTSETILRLPSPVLTTRAARVGATELRVQDSSVFLPGTTIDILPPAGHDVFIDAHTEVISLQRIVKVERGRIHLAEPLPVDIGSKCRIGYANKILRLGPKGNVVVENLTFDGGQLPDIPMPGLHLRASIWAAAPFGYEVGNQGQPLSNITIRHCNFQNSYGPGVAFYHVVNGRVEGCRFENMAEEAIDFDHFSQRCRAVGNEIRDAALGIVMNDTAYCTVEFNRIYDCGKGIYLWWFEETPRNGVNVFNTIQHNFVTGSEVAAIHLARHCHRNMVVQNYVERPILVEEDSNKVVDNTRL
jgi:parallel beta-helix repeat protein